MIKVTVKDSFHLSGIGQFKKGDEPEFTEKLAKDLEDKGLVSIGVKATGAPSNKMLTPEEIANKQREEAEAKAKKDAEDQAKAEAKAAAAAQKKADAEKKAAEKAAKKAAKEADQKKGN